MARLGTARGSNKTYDHAWAQTHAEKTENTANLTLEISAEELSLNLVGFYSEQFEKVRDWIHGRPGRNFLKSHPELILVIFVRTAQKGKGGHPMWKGAESDELERLKLSEASPYDVTMRLSTLSRRIDSLGILLKPALPSQLLNIALTGRHLNRQIGLIAGLDPVSRSDRR